MKKLTGESTKEKQQKYKNTKIQKYQKETDFKQDTMVLWDYAPDYYRELEGSNLAAAGSHQFNFFKAGSINFLQGDGEQRKERRDGKWKPNSKH